MSNKKLSKKPPLTANSYHQDYPKMLNSGQKAEECDATDDDSNTKVWVIKIFLN